MSWKDYVTYTCTNKILYKGIDLGLTREAIEDLSCGPCDLDCMMEDMYQASVSFIRNKKINDVLDIRPEEL